MVEPRTSLKWKIWYYGWTSYETKMKDMELWLNLIKSLISLFWNRTSRYIVKLKSISTPLTSRFDYKDWKFEWIYSMVHSFFIIECSYLRCMSAQDILYDIKKQTLFRNESDLWYKKKRKNEMKKPIYTVSQNVHFLCFDTFYFQIFC